MPKIFIDPQGNVQRLTPTLEEIAAEQPNVFKVAECTDLEYMLYANGFVQQDGVPVIAEQNKDVTLNELKTKKVKDVLAFFEEKREKLKSARIAAVMMNNNADAIDEGYKKSIDNQRAILKKIQESKTIEELASIKYR